MYVCDTVKKKEKEKERERKRKRKKKREGKRMGGGKGGGGRTKSADASIHPVNVSLGSLDTKRAPPRNKMAAFESSLVSGKKTMSPLSLSATGETSTDVNKLPLMGGGSLVYNDAAAAAAAAAAGGGGGATQVWREEQEERERER